MTREMEQDYELFLKALGARIKAVRKKEGLSLRGIVEKYNYHDSQWRRFERNGTGSLDSLRRIAKILNTSVSMLLDGIGEYPSGSLTRMNTQSHGESESKASDQAPVESGTPDRRTTSDRRKKADRRKR